MRIGFFRGFSCPPAEERRGTGRGRGRGGEKRNLGQRE